MPGNARLKAGQLLSEEEYRDAINKYGNSFKAAMGAEAIKIAAGELWTWTR